MDLTTTTVRSFDPLNLSAETLASLDAMGYKAPTDVQFETIPRAQAGKDLVVQSRTGTGKTAAFGIPITAFTVFLVASSHMLCGVFAITPGGVGRTQALDVATLSRSDILTPSGSVY